MIRFEEDVVIERPIEVVWEFVSDLDNLRDWDSVVLQADWQRPLGVGSTFKITSRFPTLLGALIGKRMTSLTVSDYKLNRRIGWEFYKGASKGKNTYSMESAEGSRTKLSRTWVAEVGGLLEIFQPIIARATKRGRAVGITNVKRIMENRPRA
jgi:carbon monoxide dehydrogenase subunit G